MRTLTMIGTALLCTAAAVTPVATAAATSAPATSAPTADTVLLDCQGHARTRPDAYLLACGDGNNVLSGIHWTTWSADSAVATATDHANDCRPNCAAGRFRTYAVTVTLDEPRTRDGRSGATSYGRITLHYTGDRPEGVPADVSAPLPVRPA
jgi:hypothetical protein